ncbi:unnamed protein product [Gongylonema pulchrum]|uniref:G protein-coupled receptor n=1 Tax=Gongylonema pulchrum TaxID=637853 RepID=A0A183DPP6_9BILA|nr:unnamed protein product [Gongylonema pulchrum]
MVFPKMRMDCARRRKYALFACGMHTFAAFCLFVSEANYLLMLPLLVRGITRFFVHGRAVNYLLGIQPFVASVLQALMLALHVYSIVAFAEQRESYSRWKPRYLLFVTLLYSQVTYTSYYAVAECEVLDATATLPAWILPFPRPYPRDLIQFVTLLYSQVTYTSYYAVAECEVLDATATLPAWILPFPRPYPRDLIQNCIV